MIHHVTCFGIVHIRLSTNSINIAVIHTKFYNDLTIIVPNHRIFRNHKADDQNTYISKYCTTLRCKQKAVIITPINIT